MSGYERLAGDPHAIRAFGATPEEVFEHAAFGLYDIAYDLSDVPPTYSRPIIAPGDNDAELLTNWLEELLFVSQRESLVWSWFVVDRLEEGGVQGSAAGMPVAQVPSRRLAIAGVDDVPSGLVPVPEGWWTEVRFRTSPDLRLV
jgi:SHS2 domain-containing protein